MFNVLANDPFWPGYTGERRITGVADVSEGTTVTISADGKSLSYTSLREPQPAPLRSDISSTVPTNRRVSVLVYRPVQDDSFEVDRNSTGFFFNVTANDFYRDSHNIVHDVIDRVTSVTQPASGGTVTISADGKGNRLHAGGRLLGKRHVHLHRRRRARSDGARASDAARARRLPVNSAIQDTPNVVLDVLANDFVGNGYTGAKLITSVGATKNGGTVTIRATARQFFTRRRRATSARMNSPTLWMVNWTRM